MPVTNVAGGVDPISRVRAITRDTTTDDAAIRPAIRGAVGVESLLLYLPTGTDGASGATAEVALDSPSSPTELRLILSRTISGEIPDPIAIAATGSYSGPVTNLASLVDAIGALRKGWRVGFTVDGADRIFVDPTNRRWITQLRGLCESLPEFAPALNLAVAAAVPAYGTEDDAAVLRLWAPYGAAMTLILATDRAGGAGASVSSVRLGNAAVTLSSPRAELQQRAAQGVYAA